MKQRFNSVQFFKCNDLVTENSLFVSLIDFRLSKLYHYITKVHFSTHSSKSQSHFYVFTCSIIPSENRFFITSQKKSQVTFRIPALTTISRNQKLIMQSIYKKNNYKMESFVTNHFSWIYSLSLILKYLSTSVIIHLSFFCH